MREGQKIRFTNDGKIQSGIVAGNTYSKDGVVYIPVRVADILLMDVDATRVVES